MQLVAALNVGINLTILAVNYFCMFTHMSLLEVMHARENVMHNSNKKFCLFFDLLATKGQRPLTYHIIITMPTTTCFTDDFYAVCAIVVCLLSVRPYIRLSVISRSSTKVGKLGSRKPTQYDSTRNLVF